MQIKKTYSIIGRKAETDTKGGSYVFGGIGK